jgi:glyoxylase I family protein
MEVVSGIGGLFFRARDPAALAAWYQAHPGLTAVPVDYDGPVWQQQAGPTAFAPFAESTDYFGAPGNRWMVNFRVRSLDAMVAAAAPRRHQDRT